MKILRYKDILEKKIYKIKWTKEKCAEEALKYKSRVEFLKNSRNIYNASVRNGWLDEICSHMEYIKRNNYWTKEKCAEEALKYKTRSEFEIGSPTAYVKSGKYGWKDEICSHMKSNGNLYNRCIYAVEFPDNNVYIGLSYDHEKRFHQHLNDIENNSIVLRHNIETGLKPKIIKLTDYVDIETAKILEDEKLKEYKNNGWEILNMAKCGSLGGKTVKWTKENCQAESLKYKNRNEFKLKSRHAYHAARRNKWLDEICKHMNRLIKNWNYETCREEASKYKNRNEFKLKSSGAYGYAYNNNLLNNFFPKSYD